MLSGNPMAAHETLLERRGRTFYLGASPQKYRLSEFVEIKKVCPKTPFSCGLPRRVFPSGGAEEEKHDVEHKRNNQENSEI